MKTSSRKNEEGPGKPRCRQAPAAWTRIAIGDLLKKVGRPVAVEASCSYREIGIRSHCKGIFHKPPIQGKELGSKRVFWVEPGCLVFNIIFAWEQAVAMTTESEKGMIASHRFPMYRSTNGNLLPEYAHLHFSSPRGKYDLGIASPGGAGRNKTLGQDEFKRLELLTPSIEFQRLTVNVINTWTRAINQVEALLAAKENVRKGLLQQLLVGKKRLAGHSSAWTPMCLGDAGTFSKGAGVSKSEAVPDGLPAVRYGELYTIHHVVIKDFQTRINAQSARASRKISRGDILIAGSGETPEEIGKAAAFLGDFEAYAGGDIVIFSPKKADPVFLSYLLNSAAVRRFIQSRAQGQSVVHLYRRDLEELPLLLPKPVEQRQIAQILTAADREIDILKSQVSALQIQRRGLIQNLLSGRNTTKG